MSVMLDGRDINELRVVDLRAELEKRGLDKSGNKQVLLDRLQKAIKAVEGGTDDSITTDEVLDEKSSNGAETEMSSDILDLNSSSEVVEKKNDMASSITGSVKAEKDIATKEEHSAANNVSNGNDGADDDVKTELEVDADLFMKTELEKAQELTLHDETSHNEEKSTPAAADSQQVVVKSEEMVEDIDGDLEARSDMDMDKEKELNGQDDSTTGANGGAEDKDKKNSTTTTSASAKDGKKDVKKEVDQAEKNNTPPSKIKERLVNDQNRNLWITNISQTTRATELKQALSEHGKVVGAKVVINARHPAACCYGYVRMETVADADNCIAKLNNTELNGQIIRIEKVRPDHLNPNSKPLKTETPVKDKPSQKTPVRAPTPPVKEEPKKERKPVEAPPKDDKKDKPKATEERKSSTSTTTASKTTENTPKSKDRDVKDKDNKKDTGSKERSRDRDRDRRRTRSNSRNRSENRIRSSSSTGRPDQRSTPKHYNAPPRKEVPAVRKEKDILTFDKIKTERERERLRERERELRMRRREESERVKEIERRQRSEEARLERERQKIKEERERLERERAELLSLERERQKREREKIELERLELQRAKLRIQEEERRAVKRPAPTAFREREERSYEERKRPVTDRHFAEAPPPPRFDGPSSIKTRDPSPPPMKKFSSTSSSSKDYKRLSYEKRDSYPPKRDYDERTSHSSAISRSSGGAPVPKYESNSSSYSSRDRDMRTSADPRSTNVRNSSSSGIAPVSSSKYDSKVRYSERERDRSPHFSSSSSRSLRDDRERRPVSDSKSDIRSSRDHRYPEPKVESVRYDRTSSSSGTSWSQHKSFSSPSASSNKPWSKDTWRSSDNAPSSAERWSANASRPGIPFSSNPSMNLGPSCPPPPGINTYVNDRFDYKSNMSNMRKY